jgi:hypothetical protein
MISMQIKGKIPDNGNTAYKNFLEVIGTKLSMTNEKQPSSSQRVVYTNH